METIKSWFEEMILGLGFVEKNLKNSYRAGELNGSKSIEDNQIEEKQGEVLALIKQIEDLTIQLANRKIEVDEEWAGYHKEHHDYQERRIDNLASQKLNELLSPVDLTKIVSVDKDHGVAYIGGIRAEAPRLANLRSEAEMIASTDLWDLLYETPKELAQRQMFVSSESKDDLIKGKSILYTLATQKNIIDMFKSYAQKTPLKPTGAV